MSITDKEYEEVELIASGYEWTCPSCECLNTEEEVYNEVICDSCNKTYKVDQDGIHHAFH